MARKHTEDTSVPPESAQVSCGTGGCNIHFQMEKFSALTLVFKARNAEKQKGCLICLFVFFIFSFMDVLKTREEKTTKTSSGARPPLTFGLLTRHQRCDLCGADTFTMRTGPGAGTALLPAPPLLHRRPGGDSVVPNKLDRVSGNA